MTDTSELLSMTADIVTAMVSNNDVAADQLPSLIASVHSALAGLGQEPQNEPKAEKPVPAVTVRKSLADPNVIISMIDGKPYSTLKRHLTTNGYTPESYRAAFDLKADYPMVAPGYSERRREVAMKLGLGRKKGAEPVQPEQPARKGRKTLKMALGKAKDHLGSGE